MRSVRVDESWIVIVCGLIVHASVDGFVFSFGIIGSELINKRHFTRTSIALLGTIFEVSLKLSAFVASGLCHVSSFGMKYLLLMFGISPSRNP